METRNVIEDIIQKLDQLHINELEYELDCDEVTTVWTKVEELLADLNFAITEEKKILRIKFPALNNLDEKAQESLAIRLARHKSTLFNMIHDGNNPLFRKLSLIQAVAEYHLSPIDYSSQSEHPNVTAMKHHLEMLSKAIKTTQHVGPVFQTIIQPLTELSTKALTDELVAAEKNKNPEGKTRDIIKKFLCDLHDLCTAIQDDMKHEVTARNTDTIFQEKLIARLAGYNKLLQDKDNQLLEKLDLIDKLSHHYLFTFTEDEHHHPGLYHASVNLNRLSNAIRIITLDSSVNAKLAPSHSLRTIGTRDMVIHLETLSLLELKMIYNSYIEQGIIRKHKKNCQFIFSDGTQPTNPLPDHSVQSAESQEKLKQDQAELEKKEILYQFSTLDKSAISPSEYQAILESQKANLSKFCGANPKSMSLLYNYFVDKNKFKMKAERKENSLPRFLGFKQQLEESIPEKWRPYFKPDYQTDRKDAKAQAMVALRDKIIIVEHSIANRTISYEDGISRLHDYILNVKKTLSLKKSIFHNGKEKRLQEFINKHYPEQPPSSVFKMNTHRNPP